jgi:gas vesicle protein
MAHSHSVKEYPKQIVGVALISALAGAVSAVLFTPKKGADVRKLAKKNTLQAMDRFQKTQKANKSRAKRSSARLAGDMTLAKKRVRSTASKVKQDTKATAGRAKTTAKRTKKEADKLADEIRRNGEP